MNEQFLDDLQTAMDRHKARADESYKTSHNSYRSGYDKGFVNALGWVMNKIQKKSDGD